MDGGRTSGRRFYADPEDSHRDNKHPSRVNMSLVMSGRPSVSEPGSGLGRRSRVVRLRQAFSEAAASLPPRVRLPSWTSTDRDPSERMEKGWRYQKLKPKEEKTTGLPEIGFKMYGFVKDLADIIVINIITLLCKHNT